MGTIKERKTSKGKTVFDASVRRGGYPRTYRSFSRLTDARCWVQEMEFKIRTGLHVTQAEAERHTLSDAIERFVIEELPKKPKIMIGQQQHLLWFKKQIGHKALANVSPALITELKGKFLRESSRNNKLRKPQTWNRYLTALSCVFEACTRDWQWLEHNPARRVRREREAPGRVRFLSDEERARLLKACQKSTSPNLYPLVVLTLSTGMRRSEVWKLTWQQVDLINGVIILSETKNKEYRRVALRGLALELIRQHAKIRRIDSNWVFPGDLTSKTGKPFHLDGFWAKAAKAAGLQNFRFHDLRHSCASCLAMNGASLLEIAEVLGHKTLQMVKRYSHLAESHTAGVVADMNRKIFGI